MIKVLVMCVLVKKLTYYGKVDTIQNSKEKQGIYESVALSGHHYQCCHLLHVPMSARKTIIGGQFPSLMILFSDIILIK